MACASGEEAGTSFASLPNTMATSGGTTEVGESSGQPVTTGEAETSPGTTSEAVTSGASSTGDTSTGGTTGGESSESGMSTGIGEGGCADGTQDCPCYGNMTCNDGLACADEVCVPMQAPVCGDGMLGGMEECDAGMENGDTKLCKANCTTQKCGDGFVGPGEACDDGNVESADACIACKAAACGDTFVQAGVEECDDGNGNGGDGCSAACKKEAPKCGGNFTTDWCPQSGTKEQFTRCESVSNGGKTCNNPFIKYGTLENGIPASHVGNDFPQWCTQLGFGGFGGQVSYGNRPCDAPQGKLFGCTGYDEAIWHWCDWQDGNWYNQTLNYYQCNDGQEVTSITCQ